MNKNLLRAVGGAALALALVAGYWASVHYRAEQDPYAQIWANQKAYLAQQDANDAKWNALEAQDTYGGATPEATWQMYIDALKKGDVELAAKYYRVDQWDEEKSVFTEAKKLGNLEKYVQMISSKMQKVCSEDNTDCQLTTEPFPGSTMGATFFFRLNKQASVWKLYDETKNHNN